MSKYKDFKNTNALNNESVVKAEKLGLTDAEKKEKFEKEYIEITQKLNEGLEDILDDFVSEGLRVLRDVYPDRPQGILKVLRTQEDRLRELSQTLIQTLEIVFDPNFKECHVKYIHKILDLCNASTYESLFAQKDALDEKTN
jgi:hypothetical protein